jgi:hypothetical protein
LYFSAPQVASPGRAEADGAGCRIAAGQLLADSNRAVIAGSADVFCADGVQPHLCGVAQDGRAAAAVVTWLRLIPFGHSRGKIRGSGKISKSSKSLQLRGFFNLLASVTAGCCQAAACAIGNTLIPWG